jgi:hypothetical protein
MVCASHQTALELSDGIIKSRNMRWSRHVARIQDFGKKPSREPTPVGRSRLKCEEHIERPVKNKDARTWVCTIGSGQLQMRSLYLTVDFRTELRIP